MAKFILPTPPAAEAQCRSCGVARPVDEFRIFQVKPTQLHMDFCVHCEKRDGTLTLYRRYNAYGTPEIIEAVLAAAKTPEARRSPDQARLLIAAKPDREPETNEEVLQREMARRELCRRRLVYFTTTMDRTYKPGWVHQDICRRLERFVAQVEAGLSPRLMLAMPPRSGKLLAHSTPVLTTAGWKTHGDIRPGDYVFHPSGAPTRVVATSSEDLASYEVVLTNGDVIKAHPEHEWTVFDRSRGAWRTVTTAYLAAQTLHSGPKGKRGGRYRMQLPNIAPLVLPDATLLMPPYALGAWLGDGSSSKPWITHAESDAAVIAGVTACGYTPTRVYVHATTGVHTTAFTGQREKSASHRGAATCLMKRQLAALGVLNNKHIPEAYLHSSIEQRLQLLAGLIDTDGCVDTAGRVTITTAMPVLADGIMRLVRELGMRPYCHEAAPVVSSSGIVGKKTCYVIGFQPTMDIPARLPRKATTRTVKQRREAVVSVRPATPERGRCIQVASADGLYLVGKHLTPTHNSRLASDIAVSWILGKHPEWSVIGASYAQSLPIEFSRNIRDRLSDPEYRAIFPNTVIRADAKAVEQWRTSKGGGYKTAGVGVGLTGFGGTVMVADDLIKDAAEANSETVRKNTFDWYQSVFRTRLAPGGGILMIGTRWHHDDPAGRLLTIGEELRKQGVPDYELEGWEVVSYPALAEHDEYLMVDGTIGYDVVEEEAPQVVRKLRNKGEALHPERYPAQELMKIKRTMTTGMWSALYQQNPTPDEGDFFMRDDFKFRWLDPAYRPLCRIFMTADYAIGKKERNDFTVLAVFALDSNDDLYVLEIRRGRWGTLEIAQNAAALAERHKVEVYAGEQGAIHHAVWPIIKQELDKKRIYPSVDDSLTPIQDKETRARPLQGRMQRRKLFFSHDERDKPEIYDIAEREMLQFPNAANDDIVDALAWGARLALNLSLPTTKAPPRPKSWKDDLDATITGASNFMAA